jgi:hypothetical protein
MSGNRLVRGFIGSGEGGVLVLGNENEGVHSNCEDGIGRISRNVGT